MKFREAVAEAYRRTGSTEDEIKERLKLSDMRFPTSASNIEIPAGKEELIVGEIIKMRIRLDSNPEEKEELRRFLNQEAKKKASQN